MTDITVKKGASVPDTVLTLTRPDDPDTPLPVAGATVVLKARHRLPGVLLEKALSIQDYSMSQVLVNGAAGETAVLTAGSYDMEIWVFYPDGDTLILPPTGAYTLTIAESIR